MAKGEKTGGRTKGTPNKTTAEIREQFKKLLDDNFDGLQADLELLKPVDRVKCLLELSKFILPQLKAIELDTTQADFRPVYINLSNGIKPNDDE